MAIEPANRQVTVHRAMSEVHADLLLFVAENQGEVETVADTYIEATFGSRAKTFFKGTGIADSDDLPKKLEAYLEADGDVTKLRLLVTSTQSFGTLGAGDRYEEALSTFADRTVTAMVS